MSDPVAADTGQLAEDVLLIARYALYPHAFDPEDGLDAAGLVRFREWFDPFLAFALAAARAEPCGCAWCCATTRGDHP